MATTTTTRIVKFQVDQQALTASQRQLAARHAGAYRCAWNWGLTVVNECVDREWAALKEAAAHATTTPSAAADLLRDKAWRARTRAERRARIMRELALEIAEGDVAEADLILTSRDQPWKSRRNRARMLAADRRLITPDAYTLGALFTHEAEAAESLEDSRVAWWRLDAGHGVNRHTVAAAFANLTAAITRAYKLAATPGEQKPAPKKRKRRGRKDGRLPGWPRYKKYAPSAGTIVLRSIAPTDPWRIISDGHRIIVPNLGSVRVSRNTRPLRRLIRAGGAPKSALFRKNGDRWSLSITVTMPLDAPIINARTTLTRTQKRNGTVGVDLGVKRLATCSDGTTADNMRLFAATRRELALAQRRIARAHHRESPACFKSGKHVKGGCAWTARARAHRDQCRDCYTSHGQPIQRPRLPHGTRVPATACTWRDTDGHAAPSRAITRLQSVERRLHRLVAARRDTMLHALTKRLASQYETISIEDLNVTGMLATPAPKPDPDKPDAYLPNGRASKRGLARAIADAGFYEIRRQLEYKTAWYGSRLHIADRYYPSSKTCSTCRAVKPKLRLDEREYDCDACGLRIDRDLNAAINLAHHAKQHPAVSRDTDSDPGPLTSRSDPAPDAGSARPVGRKSADTSRTHGGPQGTSRPHTRC